MSDYQSPQLTGPVFVPADSAAHVGSWFPVYPDRVEPKRALTAAIVAGAFFFASNSSIPPPPLSWAPVAPAAIDRVVYRAATQQSLALWPVPIPGAAVVPALSWLAHYPDLIAPKPSLRPASQQALALPPYVTPPVLSWRAQYPDRIHRVTYAARHQQALALYPLPIPNVPYDAATLSWWPHYPDWQLRPRPQTPIGYIADRIDTKRITKVCVVDASSGQPMLTASSGQPEITNASAAAACVTGSAPDCEST